MKNAIIFSLPFWVIAIGLTIGGIEVDRVDPVVHYEIINHLADENGYMHPFPCHGKEIMSSGMREKDGCYDLSWEEYRKKLSK